MFSFDLNNAESPDDNFFLFDLTFDSSTIELESIHII